MRRLAVFSDAFRCVWRFTAKPLPLRDFILSEYILLDVHRAQEAQGMMASLTIAASPRIAKTARGWRELPRCSQLQHWIVAAPGPREEGREIGGGRGGGPARAGRGRRGGAAGGRTAGGW